MSVLTFASGDNFVFRLTKSLETNPDNKWANSYEFTATTSGAIADIIALGEILADFEVALHLNTVVFDRLLVSTWEADSVPYNPESFFSTTLTATGANDVTSDMLPLSTCLSVSRQASTGRFGHIFYRGVLMEASVEAPAGKYILVDRPSIQTILDDAISSSGLDAYIGVGATESLSLAMISADGSQVRTVNNLRAQGVSQVKSDHMWFNRTPAP